MQDLLKDIRDTDAVQLDEVVQEPASEEPASSGVMDTFFTEVNDIRMTMGKIRSNLEAIEELQNANLVAIGISEGEENAGKIEKFSDQTDMMIKQLNAALKKMLKENRVFENEQKGTAEARMRGNMHTTLTRQLMELTTSYRELQSKYKDKFQGRLVRQFKIVKPDATEEEIEDVLQSGQQDVFTMLSPEKVAEDTLRDIIGQNEAVKKLEESIRELHQLFVDMAVLVEAQGELIDQIEHNVDKCVDYVEKGAADLEKAVKYQRKSRKKLIIIAILIVVAVVVAVIFTTLFSGFIASMISVYLGFFLPNNNNN